MSIFKYKGICGVWPGSPGIVVGPINSSINVQRLTCIFTYHVILYISSFLLSYSDSTILHVNLSISELSINLIISWSDVVSKSMCFWNSSLKGLRVSVSALHFSMKCISFST